MNIDEQQYQRFLVNVVWHTLAYEYWWATIPAISDYATRIGLRQRIYTNIKNRDKVGKQKQKLTIRTVWRCQRGYQKTEEEQTAQWPKEQKGKQRSTKYPTET